MPLISKEETAKVLGQTIPDARELWQRMLARVQTDSAAGLNRDHIRQLLVGDHQKGGDQQRGAGHLPEDHGLLAVLEEAGPRPAREEGLQELQAVHVGGLPGRVPDGQPLVVDRADGRRKVLQVQAVADRAACGVMAVEGSTLFSEDGAKTVRKHFKNILESLVPLGQDDEESEHEPASPTDVT